MHRTLTIAAAAFGATAVGLGAFGAHALRTHLSPSMLAAYQTGVQYQLLHAIALLATAGLYRAQASLWYLGAAGCFAAGMIGFCGSLYVLTCTGIRAAGPLTPIGGLVLIWGWICLGIGAWQKSL